MRILTVVFTLVFMNFSLLSFAQEKKKESMNNSNSGIKKVNSINDINDQIKFKNQSGNAIITITDEGNNKGSITIPDSTEPPSTTLNKLYNVNGILNFNGTTLGSGSTSGWTDDGTVVRLTNSTDRVGIGTSSPLAGLHLDGSGFPSSFMYLQANEGGDAGFRLYEGAMAKWHIFNNSTLDGLQIYNNSGSTVFFADRSTTNVGIGTKTPSNKLEVAGTIHSTSGGIKFPDNTTQTTAAGSSFWTAVLSHIYSNNSGNVGIGDTSPTHKLEVAGKIGINDTTVIYLPDQTTYHGTLYIGNGGKNSLGGAGVGPGWANTGIGIGALFSNLEAYGNTAVGSESLYKNETGSYNVAAGYRALYNLEKGFKVTNDPYVYESSYNVALGAEAGFNLGGPSHNVAIGYQSLYNNGNYQFMNEDWGNYNIAVGSQALFNTQGTTYTQKESENNIGIGYQSLYNNSIGNGNTGIGEQTGLTNTEGDYNTFLGYKSDVGSSNLENATAIGANAEVNASNKVRIGDENVTVIEGQVDWTYTSDRNKKEYFVDVDGERVLREIRDFSIQSWNYKHDTKKIRHYGPVSQDFYRAFGSDEFGTIGSDTTLCGSDVVGINMIAIQTLEKRTTEQRVEIDALKMVNAQVLTENEKLRMELSLLKSTVLNLIKNKSENELLMASGE